MGYVESVHLTGTVAVQASPRNFRLHQSFLWEFVPFAESLPEIGDAAVTRQTMAGAIYAGLPARSNDDTSGGGAGGSSLLQYVYSLATAYHTTHATPPTMKRAAARLAMHAHPRGSARALHVAAAEAGHDTLALLDIAAFGLPAEAFVERVRPADAFDVLALFSRLADSDEPIAVFGYLYALERMATLATAETIATIERLVPAGINATRCLREHSSVGGDAGHVSEAREFIASLPPYDRATIARAAHETSVLMHSEPSDYPGDEAMRALLQQMPRTQPFLDAYLRAS